MYNSQIHLIEYSCRCITSAMAPVFVKISNELNRIKLLLNNQLDSDYRKSVWSPFVCGECRICRSSTGPKNTKKSTSWATTVRIRVGFIEDVGCNTVTGSKLGQYKTRSALCAESCCYYHGYIHESRNVTETHGNTIYVIAKVPLDGL